MLCVLVPFVYRAEPGLPWKQTTKYFFLSLSLCLPPIYASLSTIHANHPWIERDLALNITVGV